ncbi:MAG: alpha-amylase [Candidatus Pacebacteria bacterium CG10_big_fil_rev_8_21_14_0_10_56_10]|nr:MAG: alpha-amylase [Candidatus Pacebacteria bacterium CG10_big_fil_rev_8_21_14_0_10_56_10]
MPQLCLYFQLHQPLRLNGYDVFDLSNSSRYFDLEPDQHNAEIFRKVAAKSYLPMLRLLLELIGRHSDFCLALSCSGVFLEQAQQYRPDVIELLKQLAATGRVEFLAETYYHSLSSLFSETEFKTQIRLHSQAVHEYFGQTPTIFRNTELVYANQIGWLIAKLGFQGMLTEAVPRYLGDRPKTRLFRSYTEPSIPLLLKHAELSDDVAFRFSNRGWPGYPLTADKYLDWVNIYPADQLVNLFMDFETFGEHQWADTGIFAFFAEFVDRCVAQSWNTFVTPGQVCTPFYQHGRARPELLELPVYDVPDPISWADVDRDLTAWIDNPLQQDSIRQLYGLQDAIVRTGDMRLITDWRRLQISDHFYYMCTKWAADGDVHAYFSPYPSPYEAYRRYSIVLTDLFDRAGVTPTSGQPLY